MKKSTKRFITRISIVGVILVAGVIAIAQSQFGTTANEKPDEEKPDVASKDENLDPIPAPDDAAVPILPPSASAFQQNSLRDGNSLGDGGSAYGDDSQYVTPPRQDTNYDPYASQYGTPSTDSNDGTIYGGSAPYDPGATKLVNNEQEEGVDGASATTSSRKTAGSLSDQNSNQLGALDPSQYGEPTTVQQAADGAGIISPPKSLSADQTNQNDPSGYPPTTNTPNNFGGDSIQQAVPTQQTTPDNGQLTNQSDFAGQAFGGAKTAPAYGQAPIDIAPVATADVPGKRDLEGTQTPSITLEKTAPSEIQVGRAATFQMQVRNAGQVTARQVTVLDRVPRGTQLKSTTPEASQTADGALVWQFDALEPGEEKTISMEVVPQTEGEIGSVAQVSFQTVASVRTVCTKPVLSVQHTAPQKVLIGEEVTLAITLANNGSGAADAVILEEDVPIGLKHDSGSELQYSVGTLRPGETRNLELTLTADEAGMVTNVLALSADGIAAVTDKISFEVVAPQLKIAAEGPKVRYLERPAKYSIAISNPGTATANNVELVTFLPNGLEFVSADNQGQYDQKDHAVYWSLAELPATKHGTVELTVLPIDAGAQSLRIKGTADLNLDVQHEHAIDVKSLSELVFNIADVADPIEEGSETTYVIEVTNSGNKADANVQVAALLPAGMQYVDSTGPTKGTLQNSPQGEQVLFDPLAELNPDGKAVFKIKVLGRQAGDQLIRVQLVSDVVQRTPVTKEESTLVYRDQ